MWLRGVLNKISGGQAGGDEVELDEDGGEHAVVGTCVVKGRKAESSVKGEVGR